MRRAPALVASVAPLALLLAGAASAEAPAPPPAAARPSLDLAAATVVDLSHPFDASTVYWPTDTSGFRLQSLHFGPTPGGFFYAANSFSTAEHGGTHLDAPIHFGAGRQSVEALPLDRLVAPAVVIDVTAQANADADYRLTLEDVRAFEAKHGSIAPGTIVLLRTGYSERWPDRKRYLGDDTPGDASKLHFPAFGAEAARLLIEERRVVALGLDTASLDHGPSRDFPVHRLAAAANVPGFENLMSLDRLPEVGAWLVALPMKIAGGSGAPLRAVALVPTK
jgi:kynurenine formamidase